MIFFSGDLHNIGTQKYLQNEWMNESVWKFCFSAKSKLTNMLCLLSEGPAFSIIPHDTEVVWEDILFLGRGITLIIKSVFWGSLIHLELGTSSRKYPADNSILRHVDVVWGSAMARTGWGHAGRRNPHPRGTGHSKWKVSLQRIDITFQVSNLTVVFGNWL